MARPVQAETEAVNPDSFLDIVASIVSIMIIMVLMIGLRIKHTPVDAATVALAQQPDPKLAGDLAAEQSMRNDVLRTATEIERVGREATIRKEQRDGLALVVSLMERKIDESRAKMDTRSRENFDGRRKLVEATSRLRQLDEQRAAVERAPAEAVRVECYPTPISRDVDGPELHFQLRGNRLALIPLESLILQVKSEVTRQLYKLRDLPEMSGTVGPEGGFRLRYTMQRHDITPEEAMESHRTGSFAQLKRWTLVPVADDLGETMDEALAENSQFRAALGRARADRTTVTIWTYPDSFDAYRRIKKELYRLGIATAARPLPEGTPIAGSPDGSKSASE